MSFPNFPDKYNRDVIFNGKKLTKYKQDVGLLPERDYPEKVILTYQRSVIDNLKKKYKTKKIQGFFGELNIVKNKEMSLGFFLVSGVGAPVTVSVMEELRALGAQSFIVIDMAGSISESVGIGSVVLCTKGLRDEGTSHHYLEYSRYVSASDGLFEKVKHRMKKERLSFHEGPSWSTDAPYRESLDEITKYKNEGVLTVEMSISASYAFGKVYDIPVLGIFVISDNISSLTWRPEYNHKNIVKNLDVVCEVAVQVLMNN